MYENIVFDPTEHKYFLEGQEYISVTTLLNHFGLSDFSMVPASILEQAMQFGSIGHKICQLFDENNLGDYDPQFEPWLNGYKQFMEAFTPDWTHIEVPMISKVWGFAGTADRIGLLDGDAVLDLKFGSQCPAHTIQTAGYTILFEENYKVKIRRRYSLYVMEDTFELVQHKEKSDRSVFLGLIQAYNWKMKNNLIKE